MSEPKFALGDAVESVYGDNAGLLGKITACVWSESECFDCRDLYTGYCYQTDFAETGNDEYEYWFWEQDLRPILEDEKPTWESFKEKTGWCPVKEAV